MTKLMEKALEAVRGWPQDRQDEAATRLPLALDQLGPAPYRTSDEELRAIDEALEEIARGERDCGRGESRLRPLPQVKGPT